MAERGGDGRFLKRQAIAPAARAAAKSTGKARKGNGEAAKRGRFLKQLALSGNVSAAARAARLASSTLYGMRKRSARFASEWDAALAEALDAIEAALVDRAVNGVEKPILYGGKQVATLRLYSDAAAMFMLRSKRPEVFARSGGEGMVAGVTVDAEDAAASEFEKRLKAIERRGSAVPDTGEAAARDEA